jgi:phosphoribosylanthranilate isomerase
MKVKICGLTRPEDARCAAEAGADAVGVVMCSPGSKRSIDGDRARAIFSAAGPGVVHVVVTHTDSPEDLAVILATGPDAVQISADLTVPPNAGVKVIRVIGPGMPLRNDCDALIVDTSMGRGMPFDPAVAANAVAHATVPVILAGGLHPGNVRKAIDSINPYMVDVASGVEIAPGIKDPELIRAFVREAKKGRQR